MGLFGYKVFNLHFFKQRVTLAHTCYTTYNELMGSHLREEYCAENVS